MSHLCEAPQGALPVERLALHLEPNHRRVMLRPFMPSLVVKPTSGPGDLQRLETLMDRVFGWIAGVSRRPCDLLPSQRVRYSVKLRSARRFVSRTYGRS